ncbi:MAG: EI24 domain-containing protein [Saprospiraceae bacterium]
MLTQVTSVLSAFFSSALRGNSGSFRFILYSGLITLLLSIVLIWMIWMGAGHLGTWISNQIQWEWMQNSIIFTWLISLVGIVILWMVMKYLLLILLSPLLSLVSEKTEKNMIGISSPSNMRWTYALARSIRINMRNLIKELFATILLFIGGFIPGLNFLTIPLLFLTQAYFIGFGVMDYYFERHLNMSDTVSMVYKHKWAAITLGSLFVLLLLIPFLGVIIAPYFITVAATKYCITAGIAKVQISE